MIVRQKKPQQPNYVIASPLGKLGLTITNDKLTGLQFLPANARLIAAQSSGAHRVTAKIKKYFCDPSLPLDIPIQAEGTPLQQKIWQHLQKIPSGKTATYGSLAQKIGTSPRVIGNACRRNPIPIVIPCHRVVAATGVGGYCGKTCDDTVKIKTWLLTHEGAANEK